ncbi:MAG TPA: hypothetical protein VFA10_02265 [Ktedonobacteraceae bacterium]|nr:hypothetical protein [Ktedonobacteraceae bacterium]
MESILVWVESQQHTLATKAQPMQLERGSTAYIGNWTRRQSMLGVPYYRANWHPSISTHHWLYYTPINFILPSLALHYLCYI